MPRPAVDYRPISSPGSVFATSIGLADAAVAVLVAGSIIGGAIMQTPAGRLSDHLDRRTVIAGAGLMAAVLSVLLFVLDVRSPFTAIVLIAALGGPMHALYPIAIAHGNDRAQEGEFVTVASGLMLVFGVGAIIGPAVAASLMHVAGAQALFLFMATVYGLIVGHVLLRRHSRAAVAVADHHLSYSGPAAMPGGSSAATQEAIYLHPANENQTKRASE